MKFTAIRERHLFVLLLAAATAQAACPISECNYLDPQYQAAFSAWGSCITPPSDAWSRAMEMLAISYPRFGIAWRAQQAESKAAVGSGLGDLNQAALDEAHRRFEDRILRTAEPEALEFYNLWQLKLDQQVKQCGPMPEPPTRQQEEAQQLARQQAEKLRQQAEKLRQQTDDCRSYALSSDAWHACRDKLKQN